ncbi:hypothetical protein HPP92_007928 [Vanilla planifolia]|uniref:VHS domain-containing protein n=1 Tax=Vanilla planifolia TaxID=51239 RepID=A0A835VBP3_VANPL|nr:hypothetical protein HPP92_007928 [Vanilla planifolia]
MLAFSIKHLLPCTARAPDARRMPLRAHGFLSYQSGADDVELTWSTPYIGRAPNEHKWPKGIIYLTQARDFVKGLRKRIRSKNAKVQLLALTLLETVVKNCGDMVHIHVAEKDLPHEMVKIVKKKPDFHVKEKILVLIDTWQEVFGGPQARYPQFFIAYQDLLRAGIVFPKRAEKSTPVLGSTRAKTLKSHPHPMKNYDKQEKHESSNVVEFSFLSLSEIQNARSVMDVLVEMLNALEPGNKEGVKQEVIVDLVEQCRLHRQRVVHLVNSTS